jgi:hypothetical protein
MDLRAEYIIRKEKGAEAHTLTMVIVSIAVEGW